MNPQQRQHFVQRQQMLAAVSHDFVDLSFFGCHALIGRVLVLVRVLGVDVTTAKTTVYGT